MSGLGAAGELRGYLDRQGAAREQHVRAAPIEFAPHRGRHARTDRIADQVVLERQPIVALGQDAGIDELANNRRQVSDAEVAQPCKIAHREPSPERRGRDRHALRDRRQPRQTLAHITARPCRHPILGESRAPGHDGDEAFLRQTADEFHQQERIAPGALGDPEHGFIGSRREQIRHNLLDRFVV